MIKEAEILKEFPSPYIIQYFDYFVENFFTCIVTEYCDGGDLQHLIDYNRHIGKKLDEKVVLKWSLEIMKGLAFLHSKKVIHRDIKPGLALCFVCF